MLIHIYFDKVFFQRIPIKPDYLAVSVAGTLSTTQIIDFQCGTTLINPVIGVIGVCRNTIASRSTSKHKCWVIRANIGNLRNNLLAGKAFIGSKFHILKIGFTAQANHGAPAFGSNTRAVFDFAIVFNGHAIDISNTLVG